MILPLLGVRVTYSGWENVERGRQLHALVLFNHTSFVSSPFNSILALLSAAVNVPPLSVPFDRVSFGRTITICTAVTVPPLHVVRTQTLSAQGDSCCERPALCCRPCARLSALDMPHKL